tara:strand:+ start:119 stop:307 length:189 start_codon:yes stop_codon:yes gene_type:complete
VALLTTIEDELKSAVVVADASTKALARTVVVGTIPVIEFGLIIAFTLLIAGLPIKLIRRLKE